MIAGRSISLLWVVPLAGAASAVSDTRTQTVEASTPSLQKGPAKPSQKEISKELARHFSEHFADQGQWSEANAAELQRRQAERRERVVEIVTAGWLSTLEDWDHAAVILHYGVSPEDFLLAHVLAIPPGIADISLSRNLVAGTLDHFLASIERKELFGTQTVPVVPEELARFGPAAAPLPNDLRRLFMLEPLKRKEERRAAAGGRELRKLLESLAGEAESVPEAGSTPAWLARTREIVCQGGLKSESDFSTATSLLSRSTEADDLLLAHVCALAASFRKGGAEVRPCAETLDRFLLAIGRPQVLGTATTATGTPREPVQPVPAVVLEKYARHKPGKQE